MNDESLIVIPFYDGDYYDGDDRHADEVFETLTASAQPVRSNL